MHKFDYNFLANGLLLANLVNLTSNIASLYATTDRYVKYQLIQVQILQDVSTITVQAVLDKIIKNGLIKKHKQGIPTGI